MPPALCIHILCKKKNISLMKVDEYVIRCLDFCPRTFLLSQNLGMSFSINVKEGIIERRNRIRPRQLIARSPVNEMIIRHRYENLKETIIYLVHLLLDYQYHQHQKPTLLLLMQETWSKAYQSTI